MKIATYNIQSLFHRHVDLIMENTNSKSEIWHKEFDTLLLKDKKSEKELYRLRELFNLLQFNKKRSISSFNLENVLGDNFLNYPNKRTTITSHNQNWDSSIELRSLPIAKKSFQHKAKVIKETDADILILQEVESRNSLMQLNESYLAKTMTDPYKSIFHMAGNDCKGMGMGLLLKKGLFLKSIKTFANERDEQDNFKFENDLQLYKIELKEGDSIYVINCHFTDLDRSSTTLMKRRRHQIESVAKIYRLLQKKGYDYIIVAGTFNVPSYSNMMSPIFDGTDILNCIQHVSFSPETDVGFDSGYYRMGGYCKGVNIEQKDYLMFSPELFKKIKGSGMNRKAVWPLTVPQWTVYNSIKNERDAASDHPLLWANIKIEDSQGMLRKCA